MPNEQSSRVTFTLLQIFRGLAATLVVLVHTTGIATSHFSTRFLGNYFVMGNAGVDFFFVLSGFLICYIHGDDIGKPFRARLYLAKRLVRIYPIYWIVTLVIVPVFIIVPSYGLGDETRPLVLASSFLLFPIDRSPILVAGWTLRYEVIFYLIFALLIAVRSRWAWYVFLLWVGGVLASVLVAFGNRRVYWGLADQFLFLPQNLEFILGCAAAYITKHLNVSALPKDGWITVLVIFAAAFGFTGLLPDRFFDLEAGKHVLLYGGIVFVIIVAATMIDRLGGLSVWFTQNVFYRSAQYLGDASYSLYLIHGPCLSVTFKIAAATALMRKLGAISTVWLILAFTILMGCACHAMIERPLLSLLRRKITALGAHQT